VGLDQVPVGGLAGEQLVDVLVPAGPGGPAEHQVLPVADPGSSSDPSAQAGPDTGSNKALGIGVHDAGLDLAGAVQQAFEQVDRLPQPHGMKWENKAV
jgi:hypothetical protein